MSKKTIPKIEIELRALFEKAQYKKIQKFLNKNAKDLGEDNEEVYFFLLPDKIVKVANNTSKKTAKIVIKFNRLGRGSSDFEEIEIPINSSDFNNAIKLFSALPFEQIQNSYQQRHNYKYRGVEIALKYTKSWGYHAELEIMVSNKAKIERAKKKIKRIADELDIKIMSEQELTEFAKKVDEQYKHGLYNKTR